MVRSGPAQTAPCHSDGQLLMETHKESPTGSAWPPAMCWTKKTQGLTVGWVLGQRRTWEKKKEIW